MAADDLLVLAEDLVLSPVSELPEHVRRRLPGQPDGVAVSRPFSRQHSLIVDPEAVAMLLEFRQPSTIVDAVIRRALESSADPELLLERTYPLIQALRRRRMIVTAGSPSAGQVRTVLEPGTELPELVVTVERVVHDLEDTAVYEVRDAEGRPYALKLLSSAASTAVEEGLAREAAVLRMLDGDPSPRLVQEGELDGRPFLLLEWIDGVYATVEATRLRSGRSAAADARLLELGARTIECYALLHARGVLHGDVHPKNVLVSATGRIRLVDFGLARIFDGLPGVVEPYRGGVGFFYEPEYAAAVRSGRAAPSVTEASEQYQVAALVYLLLAGDHSLDFSLERSDSLRAIAEERPRRLTTSMTSAPPAVDRALEQALRKDPLARHPSMRDLAQSYRNAVKGDGGRRRRRALVAHAETFVRESVAQLGLGSRLIEQGLATRPSVSVNYGAAGIAYALRRVAQRRDDPSLLAAADAWTQRALGSLRSPGAFHEPRIQITPERVGPVSLFHSETGAQCVAALVADSRGAAAEAEQHALRFVELVDRASWGHPDATVGRASVVLGCSELVEQLAPSNPALAQVRRLGAELVEGTLARGRLPYYGVAHGDAGILFAALRFARATATPIPDRVRSDLDALLELAAPAGDGLRWPRGPGDTTSWAGWCHGSAGWTLLWLEAHRAFGLDEYAVAAERAGLDCAARPLRSVCSLCCGTAGQAYATLALSRATGDRRWLRRTDRLADLAIRTSRSMGSIPNSLYKSNVGVVVLAADVTRPSLGSMPLFEAAPPR